MAADQNKTVIYKVDGLAYSAQRIIPLSKSIGCMLLICADQIIYIDQKTPKGIAVAVNRYAKETTDNDIDETHADLNLKLEFSKYVNLGGDRILLFLIDGKTLLVEIEMDTVRYVAKLLLSLQPDVNAPSCAALLPNRLLFVGSLTDDSQLIHFEAKANERPLKLPDAPNVPMGTADHSSIDMVDDIGMCRPEIIATWNHFSFILPRPLRIDR